MKIIDWKAYKEIPSKELTNEELLEVIANLQSRITILESRDNNIFNPINPCWTNAPTDITCEFDHHWGVLLNSITNTKA